MEPIPLASALQEALEANPPGSGIELEIDIPSSLPPVMADRDQIFVVFGNLLRNARDAMPSGGRLSITGRRDSNSVEVAITDTGIGIPAEDLARIMEPLYSTKARGLGLGLSIARSILEKNLGSLQVTSEPGRGSTFTVRLTAAGTKDETPS
jgi:signal transduction histidine kinase